MIGTIKTIWNHGTIVQVLVANRRAARSVYFDHRCFSHVVEGEGGSVAKLIGRRCKVARDGQSIAFVP